MGTKRYELTESEWNRVKDMLPLEHSKQGKCGRPVKCDNRRTMNGILWIAKEGALWRELPERYGAWQTVYSHYRKWRDMGTFEAIFRLWWMAWVIRLLFCSVPAMTTIPSIPSLCSARLISREAISSAIKPMVQRRYRTALIRRMLSIQLRRRSMSMIRGMWTGIPIKERHVVERFFQKLKWFRKVFMRYDKLDISFLAFVHIAAIAILLK